MAIYANKVTRSEQTAEIGNARTIEATSIRWFYFLSRWSLVSGLVYVGLFIFMILWMTSVGKNSTLPATYSELEGAMTTGVLYRLSIAFDAAAWLSLAIFFSVFAAALVNRAPVLAALIAVCGFGQVAGLLGAFARLEGTTELASQYLAATQDQQAVVLQSYSDLQLTINSHFGVGALLWSIGLILLAAAFWSKADLPRWLTGIMALNGVLGLLDLAVLIATGEYLPFEFSMVRILLLLPLIFFSLAWMLWHPAPSVKP